MVLERFTDGAQRLVLVLCLPLVDGVFATLLVTGTVETFSDVVAVALTLFAGAGSLAVLYSHAETAAEARGMVVQAAPLLLVGAVLVAVVAPVFGQVFHVHRLQLAAGLALLVIAANLADLDVGDTFTVPAIVVTGFVLSVKNPGALAFTLDYVAPAVGTALVALAGLFAAASIDPGRLDLGTIKVGGAAVLITIALSLFGLNVPSEIGLAVLAASLVASAR